MPQKKDNSTSSEVCTTMNHLMCTEDSHPFVFVLGPTSVQSLFVQPMANKENPTGTEEMIDIIRVAT